MVPIMAASSGADAMAHLTFWFRVEEYFPDRT